MANGWFNQAFFGENFNGVWFGNGVPATVWGGSGFSPQVEERRESLSFEVEELLYRIERELEHPEGEPEEIDESIRALNRQEADELARRLPSLEREETAEILGSFLDLAKSVKLEREMEEELLLILMGEI